MSNATTHHASVSFHVSHPEHIDPAKEAVLHEAEAAFIKAVEGHGFEVHHDHKHTRVHHHPHAPKHQG